MPEYITKEEFKDYIKNSITNTAFNFCDEVIELDLSNIEDEDFMFDWTAVTFPDSMSGEHNFKIKFQDANTYKVYHSYVSKVGDYLMLGQSDISSPFTSQFVDIPANCFGGTINIGDQLVFGCQGLISNDMLESTIEDAEVEVDDYAKSLKIIPHDLLDDNLPYFTQAATYYNVYDDVGVIPIFKSVKIAVKKFTLAILSDRKMLPARFVDQSEEGYSHRLKNSGRKNIRQFLERWKVKEIDTASVKDKNKDIDLGVYLKNYRKI